MMQRQNWPRLVALCALPALSLLVGCSADLEVRGDINRVIGSTVTLALIEGEDAFSGDLTMEDSGRGRFGSKDLAATATTGRELTFTVPAGAAAGTARVWADQQGSDNTYLLRLSINRLMVGLHGTGAIEIFGLDPTTIARATIKPPTTVSGTAKQLAITSGGGILASLVGDTLRLHELGTTPRELVTDQAKDARFLAALPRGAVVATTNGIEVYRHKSGSSIESGGQLSLVDQTIKAIAVSEDGTIAALLTTCSILGAAGSDCVTRVNLEQTPPFVLDTTQLDDTSSANLIAVQRNGQGVVVTDGPTLHGIRFAEGTPAVRVRRGLKGTSPVAIDRRYTLIEDEDNDLFAIGTRDGVINFVGFHGELERGKPCDPKLDPPEPGACPQLRNISTIPLERQLDNIAFGRGTNLIAVAGTTLFRVTVGAKTLLDEAPNSVLVAIAVQP